MSYGTLGVWYNPGSWFAAEPAPAPTAVQPMNMALPEATVDMVTSMRTCANEKARSAGYTTVIEPGILGDRTCGLAASRFGEGCLYRDLVLNTCVQRGRQFVEPVATAAATTQQEEAAEKEPSFWSSKQVLYLGLAVAGTLVFLKMRKDKKKSVRSNRRHRVRRNDRTEQVPGWQITRTATMQGRPKGHVLVGRSLEVLKDEMRHEGMMAADRSAKAGHGINVHLRELAWGRVQKSIRSISATPRIKDILRDAFVGGWNTRAMKMGYLANRRKRAA